MESISYLRETLLHALGDPVAQHVEQELFDELMVHKSRLLNLYDVGVRTAQHQKEVESGKITVNGDTIQVNSDFIRQAIFLSQQLECSERYTAELLLYVMKQNPNRSPAEYLEACVAEFHQRRRYVVDILRYLFEAAEAASLSDASPLFQRLHAFTRSELLSQGSGTASYLPAHIFKEVTNLGTLLSRADAARRNAGSQTIAASGQASFSLGVDTLSARYESLCYERRYLATTLTTISRMGYLSTNETKLLVDWLSENPNNSMTYYLLTTLFSTFDPVDPDSAGGQMRGTLAMDKSNMVFMTKKLASSTEWKDSGLKAAILLQWTLFLTETRHRHPDLEGRDGFRTEELESQIWNAIQGDAFRYLAQMVHQLRRVNTSIPTTSCFEALALTPEQTEQRQVPHDDFKPAFLATLETLVRSLITHASSELRKIKQRQEDLVLASARTDRTRAPSGLFGSAQPPTDKSSAPRNDIAMLYSFIGLLYSALPPERALQFWGAGAQGDSERMSYLEYIESTAGRLPSFLQWAVWSTQVHDLKMSMALYDMLGGLSKGQQCSELAHNFMARGGGEVITGSGPPSSSRSGSQQAVSWLLVFGLLESWATAHSNPRGPPAPQPMPHGNSVGFGSSISHSRPSHHHPAPPSIGPDEVLLAQSFLRFLANVVTYSVSVRIAVYSFSHFRTIPTLVSLIPLGIPLELKGAIFETLAAFCEPGAGRTGVEVCKGVWGLMERLEIINVRGNPSAGLPAIKGVEAELEEIETVHRIYPATTSFLKLLGTLIHTPKRIRLKDRLTDAEPINTIPDGLGQQYRLPGIGPFINFVIDTVFLKIASREYARPSERWQMNDLCLCFIERALASFDLESLLTTDDTRLREDALAPLLVHPGYDVLNRLLSTTPLQASILTYAVEGLEGFEKGIGEGEPYFRSTIVRILRIIHRVLEIQDIFLDVLVPLLSEFNSTAGVVHPRSYFTRFDQALSFGPQYIPAIASYVGFANHPELAILSIKIVSLLSRSTAVPNLIALIEQSSESDRILDGFKNILSGEATEDASIAEEVAEQCTGAGVPDEDDEPSIQQAVRLAALDLFIQNTELGRPYPNVAHFLLLGGTDKHHIQDPHAQGSLAACIHVILSLLNTGIPRLPTSGRDSTELTSGGAPLFVTQPVLAERCYRIIYQLCLHPRTFDFTMRYLRTREDFFTRHLAIMPALVPDVWQDPQIRVLYNDGSSVATTVSALSSFLRLRSCIFDLVALELHVLTHKGHFKSVDELLAILFGRGTYDDSPAWEDIVSQPFREIGQSQLRIIEFFRALIFEWSDSLAIEPIELTFLAQLNLKSCLRADSSGCEIVDRSALVMLLTSAQRTLHAHGNITTDAHRDQLELELNYILASSAIENHRRQVIFATINAYESWRRLLDVSLIKCFDRLPHTQRESTLFDVMQLLPAVIRSTDVQESTAVLLSETILSAITKLREDRRQSLLLSGESSSLPAERLHTIVRGILDSVLDSGHLELVRGNLYAALINYVHLVSSIPTSVPKAGVLNSSIQDGGFGRTLRQSSGLTPVTSSLKSGTLALMKGTIDRLVATIARDAIDGAEVWRTVAFMFLDSVVRLSSLEKQEGVLVALTRHGILSNFVRGIKDSDNLLQSVLKPDPDDLNPLYVYEAKMSLFIRMIQTRTGAEKLLDAQLIPILGQCDYLDARPESDQSFMDNDSFLPSAIQRYHQLFMPALQVINGMLATLGSKHAAVTNQALEFLSSHSSTIIIMLKNDTEDVPLAIIEEMHLLVTLCNAVLPSVPTTEMSTSHSGFGAIHSAILGLATRCLLYGWWARNVRPQTDAELLSASIAAPGLTSISSFDIQVRQAERLLRKSIVAYIGTASKFTEPEITLVLSPVTKITQSDERKSTFSSSVPSVGDALEALDDICQDLSETLRQIADLSAEIASREHVGLDKFQQVLTTVDKRVWQGLDMAQKRALLQRELEHIIQNAKNDAKMLLNTVEQLLLVLWRHIAHYGAGNRGSSVGFGSSIGLGASHAMRFASAPDPDTFRGEVGRRLQGATTRLGSVDLTQLLSSHEAQASTRYIEIMCRRLKDSMQMAAGDEDASTLRL